MATFAKELVPDTGLPLFGEPSRLGWAVVTMLWLWAGEKIR